MIPARHDGEVQTSDRLWDRTWPDLTVVAPLPLLLLPVGSFEQHGPHLPLDTDTRIALAIADAVVSRVPGTVVGPALSVTASGEHQGFPGTLSVCNEVTTRMIVELVRSADWANGVVLVNGHGGNVSAVTEAVMLLGLEGRRCLAWWPTRPSDAAADDFHAGWTETSVMLHLHPDLVRLDAAAPGASTTIAELRSRPVIDVAPTGVLGDPTGANAADGERILTDWVDDLVAEVADMAGPT